MKYVNLRVLRVLAIASSIIAPVSIGLVAGQQIAKSRAQQARAQQAQAMVERQKAREAAREAAKLEEIVRQVREGDFVVVPLAGFPQACAYSVSYLSAEYDGHATGPDYVDVDMDWECGAGNSTGCQVCIVVVLSKSGVAYPANGANVFYENAPLLICGDSDSSENFVSLGEGLPDGWYTASILIYQSSWARLTKNTPVLGHTAIGWEVVN